MRVTLPLHQVMQKMGDRQAVDTLRNVSHWLNIWHGKIESSRSCVVYICSAPKASILWHITQTCYDNLENEGKDIVSRSKRRRGTGNSAIREIGHNTSGTCGKHVHADIDKLVLQDDQRYLATKREKLKRFGAYCQYMLGIWGVILNFINKIVNWLRINSGI